MLSLMVKDFYLLNNQKKFFGMFFVLALFLLMTGSDDVFTTSFMMMSLSLFVVTTIAYDEYDNGMPFLMSMPFSRKEYVLSKYFFSIITCFITCMGMCLITIIYSVLMNKSINIQEYLIGISAVALVSQLFVSLIIPMNLRFGSEKARFAMIGFFVIIGVAGFFIEDVLRNINVDINFLSLMLENMSEFIIILIMVIFTGLIWITSLLISIKIMNKKEF